MKIKKLVCTVIFVIFLLSIISSSQKPVISLNQKPAEEEKGFFDFLIGLFSRNHEISIKTDFNEDKSFKQINLSINKFEIIENAVSDDVPIRPYAPWCADCNDENYEDGDDKSLCECDEWEKCQDFFKKSTVYNYDEGSVKTDYCIDGNTLREYYVNCAPYGYWSDATWYTDKNCDDFNVIGDYQYYCKGDNLRKHKVEKDYDCDGGKCVFDDYYYIDDKFVENCDDKNYYGDYVYYCTSTEIRKHRKYNNYDCKTDRCDVGISNWVDDSLVSRRGDEGYCSLRKKYDCSLCGHGDYDCTVISFGSDCASGLTCTGPVGGGALQGCCKSGEIWDTIEKECCECSDATQPCCDGCHYKSSGYICDNKYGKDYYSCPEGQCLGSNVLKRNQIRYCSGSSSSCSGKIDWSSWSVYDYCTWSEFCNNKSSGFSAFSCSTAECSSGVCCDSSCGIYKFKASSIKCLDGSEYGCPFGTDFGDDVGTRSVTQYCSGSSSSCTGKKDYGTWTIYTNCNSKQYCKDAECKAVECTSNSDCKDDYWKELKCSDNDVYGTFIDYYCNKFPSPKDAYCDYDSKYQKKEECGNNTYNGTNYCYGEDVYRDMIEKGCSSAKCFATLKKEKQKDCIKGCSSGVCNEEVCVNECSNGEKRCNGNYSQLCGYYDKDSCLDWPSSFEMGSEYCGENNYTGSYCYNNEVYGNFTERGCSSGVCFEKIPVQKKIKDCAIGELCFNGECFNAPDLTVQDLNIQNIKGKEVVLGFTIKNIGKAIAENVYWMVDTNSSDENPKRTTPLSLGIGDKTRAFMKWSYSALGIYNAKVLVDFSNLVNESDEGNNENSLSISVS